MEVFLIIVSGIVITLAVVYLFLSFKNDEEVFEDDFRNNNNFEDDTAQDFKPSYNSDDDYGYGYDDDSFDYRQILVWIGIAAIVIFSFWSEYADDDDDYYYDDYHRGGTYYYGTTYYGSSRRYSGYSSGGLRRSSRSFRGRSYGGGGK